MADFKQCPNGHYYQGDKCPFCKTDAGNSDNNNKTEVYGGFPNYDSQEQGTGTDNPTEVIGNNVGTRNNNNKPYTPATHTVFGPEVSTDAEGRFINNNSDNFRSTRKLVGWLVSYTLDPMGVDFKLFEGRNIIGRDLDCSITINDNMVSGKHAVLLFRTGKFSLTDSQSTHGTFVNDQDIDLDPCYLQDGDIIRIGQTILKFRTSF